LSERTIEDLESLAVRSQAGDEAAHRALLAASLAVLRVYVPRRLARWGVSDLATAEDAIQEALFAVHQKRHTYRPGSPFGAWLMTIARYKVVDQLRRAGRQRTEEMHEEPAAPVFSDPATRMDLERVLAELPERARRALALVKLEGWSGAEAAAELGMTETSLKVTVHRALQRLRAKWEGER